MLRLTAGALLLSLVFSLKCPDQQRCGDEQTCCQIHAGEFNCCPFNKTVLSSVTDVPCDDTSACPDGTTCCKNEQGGWSCCPLPQAVCCEDLIHCCPHGTTCNLPVESCDNSSSVSVPWLKKEPSRSIGGQKLPETKAPSNSDIPCDDTSACPDGTTTCCKNEQGGWSCCPLPQAVCCEDLIHCCPHGTTCNLPVESCDNSSVSVPWLKKEPSRSIGGQKLPETKAPSNSNVPCDDTSACPDGTTCCKNEQGGWSCCPLPQAVCCEDLIHCCPHGTTCNLPVESCDNSSVSVPWLKKEPSRSIGGQKLPETKAPSNSNVPCDDTSACPDGTTCCKNEQGGWSCCPLPQAVCCEDLIHCCPYDTTCDLATGSCDSSSSSVPWLKKEPSLRIRDERVPDDSVVPCNDTVACADGSTCCKTQQGSWSCCPFPQAVCCEDFTHCCPQGTKCNLASQTCEDPSKPVPWLKKGPSRPIESMSWLKKESSRLTVQTAQNTSDNRAEVTCAPHTCPDHTTCCFMQKSQKWGCCPLDQATCCTDGENCCPKGYTCRDKWCVKTSWIKYDTVMQGVQTDLDCGGGFSCKDTETCCRASASSWGCCPFPKAVCCSDMQHCCPDGYTCDQSGSCTPALGFDWEMLFSKKKQAQTL
ncbi:Granulin [Bagarius yarrelli]|uniref:Granulin n=1 Tax=Bagarius yarrelli TaxID=175774 RepID=A0A556UZK1_BAGYA|nr:Granulin [Bagarius yarrelli]